MRLVSFDPFRTLHLPGVSVLKPERWLADRELLRVADWVLFPGVWQLDSLEYGFKCRIFPSPATLRLGYDKVVTTRAMQAVFPAWMPETVIVANSPAGREEILDTFSFPFVMKVPREAMGRGVRLISGREQFSGWCNGHGNDQAPDILYAQEYLPIQRDLRVVWVGDSVMTAYWREGVDGFLNNVAQGGRVDFDNVPAEALQMVNEIATHFGIDHAGFDVALVDGHPYLLEFNVRFGNQALTARGIRVEDHIHAWLLKQLALARPPVTPEPLPRSA